MIGFQIDACGRVARIDKGADEIRSYKFDFTEILAGAKITGAPVLTVDADLSLVGQTVDDTTVTVQISGGMLGRFHPVTCRITTDETPADTIVRTMVFRIV